jgi:hypothetical protein
MMNTAAATFQAGSFEHRKLLARFFLDTHLNYTPEAIEWPQLAEDERARLAAMSFWQEAVSTENETSNTVAAAAALEPDPEIRKAIELQGFEENRHARLLLGLTANYRIPVQQPPRYIPKKLEENFLSAGYGECLDSFFAFGLFALAQESRFFTQALIEVFEPVVQEEARHILFFVNWVRYRRSLLPWWQRPLFRLRCGLIIFQKLLSRIRTARTMSGDSGQGAAKPNSDTSFTLTAAGQVGEPITLRRLLRMCLAENDRRMNVYDSRLLRPRLVPSMVKLALKVLPKNI